MHTVDTGQHRDLRGAAIPAVGAGGALRAGDVDGRGEKRGLVGLPLELIKTALVIGEGFVYRYDLGVDGPDLAIEVLITHPACHELLEGREAALEGDKPGRGPSHGGGRGGGGVVAGLLALLGQGLEFPLQSGDLGGLGRRALLVAYLKLAPLEPQTAGGRGRDSGGGEEEDEGGEEEKPNSVHDASFCRFYRRGVEWEGTFAGRTQAFLAQKSL